MALVDSTTYTGRDTDGFFSTALVIGKTKEMVRHIPNVKYKVKLASLNLGDILQADSCDVAESGTYTLAQKTLEVCDFAVNIPLCAKDYEVNYLSEKLRPGSNVPANYPPEFMGYLMKLVADKIAEQTGELFWSGDTAGSPPTLCDGFIKKFLADGTVIDVATPTTLNASNIIAELTETIAAIPISVRDKDKIKVFISPQAAHFYDLAVIAASPAIWAYNAASLAKTFMGYELVVDKAMPTNTMVACDPMNLWYGTDVLGEENSVQFIDDKLITGQKTSRLITSFKWGVEYGVGAEIVLYGTGT